MFYSTVYQMIWSHVYIQLCLQIISLIPACRIGCIASRQYIIGIPIYLYIHFEVTFLSKKLLVIAGKYAGTNLSHHIIVNEQTQAYINDYKYTHRHFCLRYEAIGSLEYLPNFVLLFFDTPPESGHETIKFSSRESL